MARDNLAPDFPAPPDATANLAKFPVRTIAAGTSVHRIHHADLGPCWFGSARPSDTHGGRFDLPMPHGSSYWSLHAEAAFLETVARRPVAVVPLEIVDRYRLTTVELPSPIAAANSPVKRARGFGLTAEFHTTADYSATRPWAAALHAAGHQALVSIPRHDVTARLRTFTIFGRAGERVLPRWRKTLSTSLLPNSLIDSMAAWGIRCLPIPFDVETL
jgi:hypothetical protein